MSDETLSMLLRCVLILPVTVGVAVAALGAQQRDLVRRLALACTLVVLCITLILAAEVVNRRMGAQPGDTFSPLAETRWDVVRFGSGSDGPTIRFNIGLDGLNIWLVALTSLLMVPSVLVSWNAITERANEFYAWLLALQTVMTGVFVSFDIIEFYVFFELTLVPLFFLIGIWGGPQRQYAARKFFVFTITGGLFTLLGILGLVLAVQQFGRDQMLTFSIPELLTQVRQINSTGGANAANFHKYETLIFLGLMVGFAVKVPVVPLHTWLPLAHVEAPTAGSVLLAGVLLKIGAYGFLRLALPLTPDAAATIGPPLLGTLGVIGIVYGAFCSLAQDDIKKLVAYSSVSHLGFCVLGLFVLNLQGITGSLLQMINHGLSTGALFLLVGMLYERYHTRRMSEFGGVAARLKLLAVFMVVACLSSAGLPGLNGFIGEVLVLAGAFRMNTTQAIIAATGVVLGAWYLLTMLRRVFFGKVKLPAVHGHDKVTDLDGRELFAIIPIVIMFVVIGVYPDLFIKTAEPDIRVVVGAVDHDHIASSAPVEPTPEK
jgi:NADH-quinone oxidoreductase subunit M